MSWSLTMLFVHIALLLALAGLWAGTPGAVQKVVLGLLGAAVLVLIVYYVAEVFSVWVPWQLKNFAHQVEHVAVMLYVLRLFVMDQERRCLPNSSQTSPSSPRS